MFKRYLPSLNGKKSLLLIRNLFIISFETGNIGTSTFVISLIFTKNSFQVYNSGFVILNASPLVYSFLIASNVIFMNSSICINWVLTCFVSGYGMGNWSTIL